VQGLSGREQGWCAGRWSSRRSASAAAAHIEHSVIPEVMVNTAAPGGLKPASVAAADPFRA